MTANSIISIKKGLKTHLLQGHDMTIRNINIDLIVYLSIFVFLFFVFFQNFHSFTISLVFDHYVDLSLGTVQGHFVSHSYPFENKSPRC